MASNNARTDFFTLPFECRAVWHNLATKRTRDFNQAPLPLDKQYYDVTLLIPKTAADPRQCQNYQFIAQRITPLIAKQPGWNGQWPPEGRWPIEDCDKPDFVGKYPWAAGCWRIAPWADIPPRVIDQGNNDIPRTLAGDTFTGFKSGDYCLASINAFAWSTNKGGISFGIEGLKKTRDGDPVGSGQRSVEQMFGGAPTGQPMYASPSAPPPPPQQPSLPPSYAPQPPQFQSGHTDYGHSLPPQQPGYPPQGHPGPAPQIPGAPPTMPQQQWGPPSPPAAGPYPGPATGPYAPTGPAPQGPGPAMPYPSSPPAQPPGNPVAPPQYGAAPQPGYPPQQPPQIGYR